MIIHPNAAELTLSGKTVVTVGSFDGVHTGHRKILNRLIEISNSIGGNAVVITFHPHPRHFLTNHGKPLFLLNTLDEKARLLSDLGIDHLVLVNFDEKFASMSPEQYIEDFLIAKFNPHTVVIGHDHRFGKERAGGFELMEHYAQKGSFCLEEIPAYEIKQATISSTLIREKIQEGEIEMANQSLGYDYEFSALVIEGNKLGRTIGFPTANLELTEPNKLVPGYGVYVVTVLMDNDQVFQAMMHIGDRPSINDLKRSIEVHVLGFDGNLYGKTIRVKIHSKLRGVIPFPNLDALKAQLLADRENAIQYFSGLI
jgi:riboflavin kinase/FMN adenylyltransferase